MHLLAMAQLQAMMQLLCAVANLEWKTLNWTRDVVNLNWIRRKLIRPKLNRGREDLAILYVAVNASERRRVVMKICSLPVLVVPCVCLIQHDLDAVELQLPVLVILPSRILRAPLILTVGMKATKNTTTTKTAY